MELRQGRRYRGDTKATMMEQRLLLHVPGSAVKESPMPRKRKRKDVQHPKLLERMPTKAAKQKVGERLELLDLARRKVALRLQQLHGSPVLNRLYVAT